MHRVATVIGHAADWGVFGAAVGLIGGTIFGVTYTDAAAIMTGTAALLVGVARAAKYFADAREVTAQARAQEIENKHRIHQLEDEF